MYSRVLQTIGGAIFSSNHYTDMDKRMTYNDNFTSKNNTQ